MPQNARLSIRIWYNIPEVSVVSHKTPMTMDEKDTKAVKSSSVYALTKETMNLLQRFATTEATPLYPKE